MSGRAQGLRTWLLQRVSGLYLAVYVFYLTGHFLFNAPADYPAWREWVGAPLVGTGAALFFVALLAHAWVGLRDVVMDYVKSVGLRLLVLTALGIGLTACGLWSLRVLWMAGVA